jgi:prolipoprotein diacylglyceryltransferase
MDMMLNLLKLLTKWKPDWLYEAMPYLYMVTGLVTMLYFDSTAGYVSGALFMVAVLAIGLMRIEHRSLKKA